MMRMGRNNVRTLDGPMLLPSGPVEMMKKVEEGYALWFRVFNETLVPLLVQQPKWFKSSRDLKVGDLVFFKKKDNVLSNKWTVGVVEEVVKSKDGLIRRVEVRYYNSGEDRIRFTDRAARSLVKLFSVEDNNLQKDLHEAEMILKEAGVDIQSRKIVEEEREPDDKLYWCARCCCTAHCQFNEEDHGSRWVKADIKAMFSVETEVPLDVIMNSALMTEFDEEETEDKINPLDSFNSLLLRTDVNFDD